MIEQPFDYICGLNNVLHTNSNRYLVVYAYGIRLAGRCVACWCCCADEYESGDSSDEEDRRNTIGAVPAWWYREYPHAGYDLDGRKLLKPPQRDHIDEFLKSVLSPLYCAVCTLHSAHYTLHTTRTAHLSLCQLLIKCSQHLIIIVKWWIVGGDSR